MSQESSAGEKPVEAWRKWTPARKAKFKRTMAEKRRAQKVTRRVRIAQKVEHRKPRGGVPLYLYTLAKQVRRAAINYLHDGEGGDVLAEHALMLARKVMEGEA